MILVLEIKHLVKILVEVVLHTDNRIHEVRVEAEVEVLFDLILDEAKVEDGVEVHKPHEPGIHQLIQELEVHHVIHAVRAEHEVEVLIDQVVVLQMVVGMLQSVHKREKVQNEIAAEVEVQINVVIAVGITPV